MQQQKLTEQEINEIKREGKRDAPEIKQQPKQVRRDQFMTSSEQSQVTASHLDPAPSSSYYDEPPTV